KANFQIQDLARQAYAADIDLEKHQRIIRLALPGEEDVLENKPEMSEDGKYILVDHKFGDKAYALSDVYLESANDGSRHLLARKALISKAIFSPDGKYALWFDR